MPENDARTTRAACWQKLRLEGQKTVTQTRRVMFCLRRVCGDEHALAARARRCVGSLLRNTAHAALPHTLTLKRPYTEPGLPLAAFTPAHAHHCA